MLATETEDAEEQIKMRRSERTKGFNDELEIGTFRMKGQFGFENFKEEEGGVRDTIRISKLPDPKIEQDKVDPNAD